MHFNLVAAGSSCAAFAQKLCLPAILLFSALGAPAAVLSGSFVPSLNGSVVNLTSEGTVDWAHWGLVWVDDFNHKAAVVPMIGNVAVLVYLIWRVWHERKRG